MSGLAGRCGGPVWRVPLAARRSGLSSASKFNAGGRLRRRGLWGRAIKVTDPLGDETKYAYDANGNLETQTDPNGNKTTYTYDADNETTKVEAPKAGY